MHGVKDFNYFDIILGRVKGVTSEMLEFFKSRLSHTGYADYQNTGADVTLVADQWTDVPNNQLGDYTTKEFLPAGITNIMDPATGYLDFSELNLGDQVHVRNDFTITPTSGTATISARYSLGSNGNEFFLNIFERFNIGASIPVSSPKGDTRITMSFPSTIIGPGKLQVKCNVGGTLNNEGSNISITLAIPFLR